MNIVYLLLIVSFVLVVVITLLFLWTVNSGQYDDLDSPSFQVLKDDDGVKSDGENDHDVDPSTDN